MSRKQTGFRYKDMRLFFLLISFVVFVGGPCQGAGDEYVTLQIGLRDVVDDALKGLQGVRVELTQFPSGKTAMAGDALESPEQKGSYEAKFRKATRYSSNPAAVTEQTWQIVIYAPGYKPQFIGPLKLHPEGDRILPSEKEDRMTATLLRNGLHWRPKFACHTKPASEKLPATVRKLQNILDGKQDEKRPGPQEVYLQVQRPLVLNLFGKPASIGIGTLSGIEFHQLGSERRRQQAERARAAMLNIAHALDTKGGGTCSVGAQPDWLGWVKRILFISEERVIARVSPGLYDALRELEQIAPAYACQSTVKASAALHTFNDPQLRALLATTGAATIVHSVKTPVCQGNVQITVAKFQAADGEVVLADFDIDENFTKGAHYWDVFLHAGSGRGTDPYEIYEMLLARGRHKPEEMGYELIRLGEKPEQCAEPGRTLVTADGKAADPN